MDYKRVLVALIWATFASVFGFAEGRSLSDLLGLFRKPKATSVAMTPSPFVSRIKDISLLSADLMHGDYVGASLDAVDFLETFDNFQWPIKLALKIAEEILRIIHPIFLKIFPGAKNDGNLIESLMFSASRGGGILRSVIKMMSSVSN